MWALTSSSSVKLGKLLHLGSQFPHLYDGDSNSTNFLELLEAKNELMSLKHLKQYPLAANKCCHLLSLLLW